MRPETKAIGRRVSEGRKRFRAWRLVGHVLIAAAGCGSADASESSSCGQPVVYGSDDREAPEGASDWGTFTRSVTVALVPHAIYQARVAGAADAVFEAKSVFGLCNDEPFARDVVLAACSGVLIAPDRVLTAGHCVTSAEGCSQFTYVLGLADGSPAGLGAAPHAECRAIETRTLERDTDGTATFDFAIVELDRAIGTSVPAIDRDPISAPTPVVAATHPLGLTLKLDFGALMQPPEGANRFAVTTVDAFVGSSGGPVFDQSRRLLGIASSGERDFVYDADRACVRSRHLREDDSRVGERVMLARHFPLLSTNEVDDGHTSTRCSK